MINILERKGIKDKNVLKAMSSIDRKIFVPEKSRTLAYADVALPIGQGQTISQPFIVAKMLELLELEPYDKVLEIGSGSGYVAALLGKLCKKVVALEINKELAEQARKKIIQLGIKNVRIINTDGSKGYLPGYPYDKILISCQAQEISTDLISQLKKTGIIIAPVGGRASQTLTKYKEGKTKQYEKCIFVPMTFSKPK